MKNSFEDKTANLLSVLGNAFRIKLLLAIGSGDACVCHLEAVLDQQRTDARFEVGVAAFRRGQAACASQAQPPDQESLFHHAQWIHLRWLLVWASRRNGFHCNVCRVPRAVAA